MEDLLKSAIPRQCWGNDKEFIWPMQKECLTSWEKCDKIRSCIIPEEEWDGDTGIPQLLEQYRNNQNQIN